jgi:hypothetical protein
MKRRFMELAEDSVQCLNFVAGVLNFGALPLPQLDDTSNVPL